MTTSREQQQSAVLVHIVAPIAVIGATMVVRKAMNIGYRKVTGAAPPDPRDAATTWMRAISWAAITAATAAIVEVVVYRLASGEEHIPHEDSAQIT